MFGELASERCERMSDASERAIQCCVCVCIGLLEFGIRTKHIFFIDMKRTNGAINLTFLHRMLFSLTRSLARALILHPPSPFISLVEFIISMAGWLAMGENFSLFFFLSLLKFNQKL